MPNTKPLTGYPSVDKPWLKYFTKEAIEAPLPKCTVYDYLWESNKGDLDNVALNYFDRSITYRELFDNIEQSTRALAALGLKSGDIIIMATVTTPEAIYAFYACNRLGIVSNMVDPRTSTDGIRDYITEVGARCVITIDVAYPKIEKAAEGTCVEKIVAISPADSLPPVKKAGFKLINLIKKSAVRLPDSCDTWKRFLARGASAVYVTEPYKENACCVIVHTGGTTGTPKGVMLSNENLNAMALQYGNLGVEIRRDQSFLNIMPPFIAYGVVLGIHMPLALGITDILIPQLDLDKFADLVIKYKPSHLAGVPTHYEKLRTSPKAKSLDLSFFRMTGCGGDGIALELEKKINEFLLSHNCKYPITKGYGMTEISSAAATNKLELNKHGSVGIPHLKTTIAIFKEGTNTELPYGEQGEVCMSAPTVMLGYYEQPAETEKILRKHTDGKLWIHSGDIGYMDEEGFLFIVGRMKRMIVRHDGFKVFPSMIENTVSSHGAVEQCCAVGIDDAAHSQGKLPVVHVTLKAEYRGKEHQVEQELYALCQKELPEYAQPVAWHFRDSLPLTPIGKVDYRALEKEAKEDTHHA